MKRHITYTRTWVVEVDGTDDNWVANEQAIVNSIAPTLEDVVQQKIEAGQIVSDFSGIVDSRRVRDDE